MALPGGVVIKNLSKSFAGTKALDCVSLNFEPGAVHVLLGQNGSGKSTLIKILSGYHAPDPGVEVLVGGESLHFHSPEHSYALGCRFVHQDLGLVDSSSVVDNLYLGSGFPRRLGTIRGKVVRDAARNDLALVGLELDVTTLAGDLGAAERTGVAIARALRGDHANAVRVLVLDEPTAALPSQEVEHLHRMIRSAASGGVAVVYVTHHLGEVFRIGDRVSVLRDGKHTSDAAVGDLSQEDLVELLVGQSLEPARKPPPAKQPGTPVLEVSDLVSADIASASVRVASGEIVGVAGITGSGRESFLAAIFGASPRISGDVRVSGRAVPARPHAAVSHRMGYLPSDRKRKGGIMNHNAVENLTLPRAGTFFKGMRMNAAIERAEAKDWFQKLEVRPADDFTRPLATFSGGNQQKILFSKWLAQEPTVLLLEDPTQGVDHAARAGLHRHVTIAAAQGTAVLMSSTDAEELALLCHRVLVFRDGVISQELQGGALNQANITRAFIPTSTKANVSAPELGCEV